MPTGKRLEAIADLDPETAETEEIAETINALLEALRHAGWMDR